MPPKPVLNINTLRVMALLYQEMDGEHYGLSIGRHLEMGNGTLYPILDKLEKMSLITGDFEDIDPVVEGRRPRRYYRLTAQGIATFEAERSKIFGGEGGKAWI